MLTSGLIQHIHMWLQKSLSHKQMQVGSFCWIKLHKTNLPVFLLFPWRYLLSFLSLCKWIMRWRGVDSQLELWACWFCFSHSVTSLLQLSTAPLCWIHHLGAFILLEMPYFFSKVQLNMFWMDFFVMQNVQFVCLKGRFVTSAEPNINLHLKSEKKKKTQKIVGQYFHTGSWRIYSPQRHNRRTSTDTLQ